jgi:hypothetical protein
MKAILLFFSLITYSYGMDEKETFFHWNDSEKIVDFFNNKIFKSEKKIEFNKKYRFFFCEKKVNEFINTIDRKKNLNALTILSELNAAIIADSLKIKKNNQEEAFIFAKEPEPLYFSEKEINEFFTLFKKKESKKSIYYERSEELVDIFEALVEKNKIKKTEDMQYMINILKEEYVYSVETQLPIFYHGNNVEHFLKQLEEINQEKKYSLNALLYDFLKALIDDSLSYKNIENGNCKDFLPEYEQNSNNILEEKDITFLSTKIRKTLQPKYPIAVYCSYFILFCLLSLRYHFN